MTGPGDTNYGIYQSGSGSIHNNGPTAVGAGAIANAGPVHETGPTVAQALSELRRLLAERGVDLPDEDRARARGEIEEIAEQLTAPNPDRSRLSAAIARLATALASVTALAVAAEALRTAAESLFR